MVNPSPEGNEVTAGPTRSHRGEAVVREIRGAQRTAASALEVYRHALARVTPLVGASFASVFLRDDDPGLLRLACAHNWPQDSARFLSELRIREGRGPTGLALAEARAVEVPDVLDDAELRDWWEPAHELGFVAIMAQPLIVDGHAVGVVSFYFSGQDPLDDAARSLLATAAHEMARSARAVELEAGGG